MPINIRWNAQQVQLVPWPPRHGEGPSWLRDSSSVRSALREAVGTPEGAAALRQLLIEAGASGVQRAADPQLVELALGMIQDGRMMLLPPDWRWRPKLMASVAEGPVASDAGPAAPRNPAAKTFFACKIVDEKTGDPVSSVRLKITLPDGVEDYYTTSPNGTVRIDDIPQGTCDIACDLTGATMQDTYEFKGEGQPPPPPDPSKVWPSKKISASNLKRIAEIERHKVADGESILSLATAAGFDWKFLARFNWGTDVPKEINRHLRDDNGIWKPTADGKNWSFTSTDYPGIMFIPKKWEQMGVSTGTEHIYKVRHLAKLIIRLESTDFAERSYDPKELSFRIPEASYKIQWDNKETREGRLGLQGIEMFEDPPPGNFEVSFEDGEDNLAKLSAGRARYLMDKSNQEAILQLFKTNKSIVGKIVATYDKYFNTYSGKGMVADLISKFPDDAERALLDYMLAQGGQENQNNGEVLEEEIYTPLPIEIDEKFGKVGALNPEGAGG